MAGGGGTRLWPLSREHYPKQFLKLSEKTLFQNTLLRLDGLETAVEILPPVIICNEAHRFLVIDQGSQISKTLETIILEPEGRNTAPALTVAALHQKNQNNNDSIMMMMPADHIVTEIDSFHMAVKAGIEMAKGDYLVNFGVKPSTPETGYGYIEPANKIETCAGQEIFTIGGFTEEPTI